MPEIADNWYTNTINVKLDEGAKLPSRAHVYDAGYDLHARVKNGYGCTAVLPRSKEVFDTGVHIQFKPGTAGVIMSRSGMNVKHGLTATGLIDCGFTGSIHVALYNHSNETYYVWDGDRIAQLVIVPISTPLLKELAPNEDFGDSERGDGGFGSTGR